MFDSNNNHTASNFLQVPQTTREEPDKVKQIEIQHKRTPFKIRKQTTIGFQRAELQQAKKSAMQKSVNYYKDEKISFSSEISHFRIYGPGIYLFFKFAKTIFFIFLILIIPCIIPTIYNGVVGAHYSSTKDSFSKYLGLVSIGNLIPGGQVHSSLTDKLINAIPTFFSSIVFFIFYIYWSKKSQEEVQSVRSSIKLISYKAVQIIKFPKDITQAQVFHYMSQFGQVKQISTVRNYQDTIAYCRQIYKKTLAGKQLVIERQKLGIQSDQKFQKQIQKRQKQLQSLYTKLDEEQKNSSKQIIKFYVIFQSPQEREKALQAFLPYLNQGFSCFSRHYPEDLRIRGEQVLVKGCHTQPAGIIWQNVHVTWKTRWIRLLLQLFLFAAVIFLGFCFILMLNVVNSPITTSNIDSSMYDKITIMSVTDKSIVRSWCLSNNNLVQAEPNSNFSALCSETLSSSGSRILISIAIALGIMVIKYALKYTVLILSKFMRYKTYAQQAMQMTKNLFLTYFFSTVFITMFMQARFDTFSPKELVKYISNSEQILLNLKQMNDFNDLSSGWYLDVGYQIWITWLILTVTSPILILTFHYPLEKICKYLAMKQVLQRKMEVYLTPEEFQIYDHYANLAIFIFVGFVFSAGMPSLVLLTAVGLGFRYLYLKYVFIRFSRVPKPIDQSLNTGMMRYLLFALFSHLILAIWMFGADDLFDHKDSVVSGNLYDQSDNIVKRFILTVIKRGLDSLYLTALLIFYTFYFFLWSVIRDIYRRCTGKQKIFRASPQMLKDTIGNGGYMIGIQSERSLTKSYKIENNPQYLDILAIIQRKQLVSTIRPQKD